MLRRIPSIIRSIVLFIVLVLSACSSQTPTLMPTLTPRITSLDPTPISTIASPSTPTSTAQLDTPTLPVTIQVQGLDQLNAYVIPLTVQHVTETSATVYFELSQPHAGVLAFKAVEQPSATTAWVQLDDQVSKHLITLKGLDPGLEYEAFVALLDDEDSYRSPSFSGEMWDPIRFNTPLKDVGLVSVGVIGDTGFGGTTTRILIEEMTNYDLDFVIHTGDVVYNVQDDLGPIDAFMKKFYSPFSPILQRMPVYPVVGNHDVNPATFRQDVPFYFHAFPVFSDANLINRGYENRREWYAFSYGSVQFVMLNSYAFYSGSGRAEQTEWLQERLSDKRFDVSVAVFHIAPYTSGKHEDDGLPIRSEWLPLFKQAGVPLVLSGHDHNYERLEIEGITYIVTGGGSTILYPVQRSLLISRVFAARTHFVLLEFYPDRIELTAIALGGNTLDAEVIRYE